MKDSNHYQTLNISPTATLNEIKQAYRRLVKLFHPDTQRDTSDRERIIEINAAYEVLSDPQRRQSYDQHLVQQRFTKTATAPKSYQKHTQPRKDADEQFESWLKLVYVPVNRLLSQIMHPLEDQLEELSADPFDDELMEEFQNYLQECRQNLNQAQLIFRSQPNPSVVAGAAVNLYYCINQLADGIDELELFTFNYDDRYIHTGQELFRIASGLRSQAQDTLKSISR